MSMFGFASLHDEEDIKVTNLQTLRRYLFKELFCGGYRSRTDDP